MKLIQENPYRIAGVLSNASERDLLRQKNKIKRLSEIGKSIDSEYDFPFLQPITRDETSIQKAFSELEQNQNRVNHSFFWFINTNPIDNIAIQHLINGNKEKAIEIWGKLIVNEEISARNFSAFNNISTLYLLNNSKDRLKQGVTYKIELLESDYFKNFVETVADETFTIDNNKQIQVFIDEVLPELYGEYSTNQLIDLFSNCNGVAKKYISNKFAEEPIHHIERQIAQTKENRIENNLNAYKYGNDLFKNTKEDLSLLKSLLGSDNLQYKILTDNLAKEILQCAIDYFNENQEINDTKDYANKAISLAKIAQNIAVNSRVKDRVTKNIEVIEEIKNREINEAIAILKSIKLAYENACKEIDNQLSLMNINSTYDELNHYLKILEMKEDCLDWSKVVEVIKNGISSMDVSIIKESLHQDKISEYKKLVYFLFSKLSLYQITQIKYLCYWEDVGLKPIKSTIKQVNKNSDGYCYIATMVYEDYEHPQVIELRKFRDNVLEKKLLGRLLVNIYYLISPNIVKIFKDNIIINQMIKEVLNQVVKIIKR